MNRAVTTCACVALLTFSMVCVEATRLLITADLTIKALPKQLDARIGSVQESLTGQISVAVADMNARLDDSIKAIDRRSGEALEIVDRTSAALVDSKTGVTAIAAKAEADLNTQLGTVNSTLSGVAAPVKASAEQIDKALPDFLDCYNDGYGNDSCIFNRWVGTAKAVEKMSQTVAAEIPKIAVDAESIAHSTAGVANSANLTGQEVAKAAQNFNKPQTKMQAFRSWLITIARIWGSI